MLSGPELLRRLVELESPTGDAERIAHIGSFIAAELQGLGARVERQGPHVRADLDGAGDGAPLVLLAHMDTVWPAGTLHRMPFRIDGEWAHGPGALDMKGGIVAGMLALREAGGSRPLRFLVTADEEVGSPTGRPLVEEACRGAGAALVLEPPVRDGTITTERSGLARYQIAITGKAAHAGHRERGGVSAVEELAHQVLALHALAEPRRGVRVNVGQVGGGTADNVVAAEGWARIDARALTAEGQRRLEAAIRGLRPRLPGATIEVRGGVTRPPMVRSEATARVAERAIGIAASLGIELGENASAGGSDGNFAAAVGAPVLDGLGPTGVGAHAPDERVSLASLEERSRLLAELVRRL